MNQKKYQTGQVALIALLVLTVATTVGLSLISRTTTDVSVSTSIEDSTRAFSAAEAGIEETLKSGVATANTTIDSTFGVSYSVAVTPVAARPGAPFVFPQKTPNENTETVWLVNHSSDGSTIVETPTYTLNNINVCWSSESTIPALVVSVLYKTSTGVYQTAKKAYDPDSARRSVNNFSAPTALTGGCNGTNTTYRGLINFPSLGITPASDIIIALRIRPVYSGTLIAIAPLQDLPLQAKRIQSEGKTQSGVNRKIVVYQQFRAPDSIFDFAVFSQGSFSK